MVASQLLMWDASDTGTDLKFSESTFTEWSQQGILFIMALLFIISAIKHPRGRALSIVLAGCASVGLVREYNNFFNDQVFDGAWQLLATLVILLTAIVFFPYRKHFSENLRSYHGTLSEGVLLAGFLTTFIFSRLFGRTTFWEAVMEENYFRSVKNAAEEGVELLGYCLLLIATIEYVLLYLIKTDQKKGTTVNGR